MALSDEIGCPVRTNPRRKAEALATLDCGSVLEVDLSVTWNLARTLQEPQLLSSTKSAGNVNRLEPQCSVSCAGLLSIWLWLFHRVAKLEVATPINRDKLVRIERGVGWIGNTSAVPAQRHPPPRPRDFWWRYRAELRYKHTREACRNTLNRLV